MPFIIKKFSEYSPATQKKIREQENLIRYLVMKRIELKKELEKLDGEIKQEELEYEEILNLE